MKRESSNVEETILEKSHFLGHRLDINNDNSELNLSKELIYLMIIMNLKKWYLNGSINREEFDFINSKCAEIQGCKMIII